MSDVKRLKNRNEEIAAMLSDGKAIRNFYRFTAQNPHISLHDACQIVLDRPNASICFPFEEWNAMGRRITKGRSGIAYYDNDGYRKFVFDANDTHGDKRYKRFIYPMKKLLTGLDALNGTELSTDIRGDYRKIHTGVATYLQQNDYFTDEVEHNKLLIEGITYSLYSKTGFPKDNGITLHGLPYSLTENAELFKEIYKTTAVLQEEIEEAYIRKQEEIKVIDDTEEENLSDEQPELVSNYEDSTKISEPTELNEKQRIIVEIHSACHSNYKGYVALAKHVPNPNSEDIEIYLGKRENYDNIGHYDNTDNSLVFVSSNPKIYRFLYGDGWVLSQEEMVKRGFFSEADYKEFDELKHGILTQFEETKSIKFGMDAEKGESGVPFRYPDWQETKQPEYTLTPFYQKYLDIQKEYPKAAVVCRLGDFYEVMGEKAVEVSTLLDLTLTGRNVGFPERVPMCGFPYHAMDRYIEKILEKLPIVLVEDGKEPMYILSHAEARELDKRPETETDGEQQDSDEWTDEEIDEALSEEYDDYDEDEQSDDDYDDDGEAALNDKDWDDGLKEYERKQNSQPQEKKGKPIKDRKRKEKPQPTLFDIMDGKDGVEQTPQEKVKEWGLKRGSGFQNGKFRIHDEYQTNPTVNEFATFLKNEYGTGGSSGGGHETASDGKGFTVAIRDRQHSENDVIVKMNWVEVANGIADLIDDGNYFTTSEQEEYDKITEKRNARIYAKTDEEKLHAIVRQFIEDGTENTWNGEYTLEASRFEESAQYVLSHRAELEQMLRSEKEIKTLLPTPTGYEYLYKENIYVEFYPEYCERLKQDEAQEEQPEAARDYDGQHSNDSSNTNLNEIQFDQSELGGKKARFRGNLQAIQLLHKLYSEERTPTVEEKRVLAKYVGWGGLAEAFDERNEQWQKEYQELKLNLSPDDYDRAKGSVLNAHYTSKEVIEGMYEALKRFGVKGNNRILEPAMGTGNFFGYMPKSISENAKLYGVELDNVTGRLAAKLYPEVNVQVKGFEQTTFTNDSFDLVVTNVPFGAYSVYDSEYAKHNFLIHDYFIAKGLDKLKPNGLIAVITSKGTLDKLNPTVRKYLADRAELLGAIRLPNTAFQKTANTQVVADILFFRKREEKINADTQNTEWLATGKTEQGFEINNYYIKHPEMVLGTLVEERGLYGALDVTVKPDGRNLTDALNEAIQTLPENVYENPIYSAESVAEETEADYDVKPLCYKAENGRLYMRVGDKMQIQPIPKNPKDAYERIVKMIALRNELRHILDLQTEGCSDEKLTDEQRKLNASYDQFVKRYGYLNNQTNKRLFREDGDSALLFACEEFDEKERTAKKQDVFSKRTIRPYTVPTATDDCFEALQISKNERGKVDIAYIEELTKKDYATVLTELGNSVFRNPMAVVPEDKYSGFETAEEYLSGNVAKKLSTVKAFAAELPDAGYEANVAALEQVQPQKVTASDISVRLGASWIDKTYYKQFLCAMLRIPSYYADGLELYYNPHDSSWRIDKRDYVRNYSYVQTKEVYGTNRANAYRLFEDCLNLKATSIYDTVEEDGREKRVLNQPETIAAREKQNKIKDAFKDWIFAEPERREELENTYNRLFNQIKLPSYDGSYLRFPEMNPEIELKPHQKNAVHRIITGGNTLLHHVVGSGKTFTICATIMKLRQYGLCKKPMIAVPNHLVQQWADEFRKLYPNANLLIASKEDLDKDNRQRFVSKVAMGDWDAVIIAQSSFAKIPISPERQIEKIREEISRIETTIEATWEENGMPRGAVKNLERIKKNREVQLKKLLDDDKKDNLLIFEKLGVDYLFVDEAHYYKNLFLFTKMNNVAGISSAASQRASDLKLKCEYINELQGGDKGVVFATGTPISNSMTEMYTMQTYLQQRTLEELGITYFDGWAADFGETVTSLEMAPSGQGYKAKTRFAKFTNMPELLSMYRSFADVQTSDMVKLDVPDVERNVITLKPSGTVIDMAEEIADRAEKISGGNVDPHIDNMLKVTSDGKKLALDARCFDSAAQDESGSKINECAFRVFGIWEQSKDIKGTQLIFCDLSTPKKAYDDYENGKDFDVYNDLKYKLVQLGIPKEEIAFIHDANTDDQKQKLFDSVNDGKTRVLIGSTGKCGAGTNIQKHLVALHHLDTPYRPSDMQQREGRIIRQGNENKNVQIFTYVTERTFDSYSYQILENKQRFISQIDKGDLTVREAEDIDETTLSYAEIKAITAANPKIKRKMEIDTEVARLRVLEGQYKKNLYSLQDKVRKEYPEAIRRQELYLERAKQDIERIKEHYNPDVFSINVKGTVYTDKKEGVRALYDALMASAPDTVVAEFGGFKISLNPLVLLTAERSITLAGSGQYVMDIGNSAIGNMTRLDNFFSDFPSREERLTRKLEQLHKDYETAEEQLKKPFEHAETLAALVSEQTQINAELDLNKREEIIIDENDNEEETKAVDNDSDAYMGLPEQETPKINAKPKLRKPIREHLVKAVSKQQSLTPDAFVFIANGDYYDIFGDKADELAKKYGFGTATENVNGESKVLLSMPTVGFDSLARLIVGDNSIVKIVEAREEKQEMDFIESVDKAAEMPVRVLPDYSISQETMHNSGYTWDGMLPLRKPTAKMLIDLGLTVYALNGDDTEIAVKDSNDLENYIGMFGVQKPDWNTFLDTDKGREYLATRFFIAMAAQDVARNDLSYVDAVFIDPFIDNNSTETDALRKYLSETNVPDVEKMYPHTNPLIELFTDRLYSCRLEYYGWTSDNVTDAIASYITPVDLKENAKGYVEIRAYDRLQNFVNDALKEIKWLNGRIDNFTEDEAEDIKNDLKAHFEDSEWDRSGDDYPFDDWYDEFSEEELWKYIHVAPEMNVDTEIEKEVDKMTDDESKAFFGIEEIDYKQEVIDSVSKEFDEFKANLTKQSPEEVFYKSFEINVKTELYEVIAENSDDPYLSDDEYRALYEEKGHILQSLYDDFIGSEHASVNNYGDTADFIKDYCYDYHEDIMIKKNEVEMSTEQQEIITKVAPLYTHDSVYATYHGELETYRQSLRINTECKLAIEQTIKDNFDGYHLAKGIEKPLIDEYGAERVLTILANTVKQKSWDGRFSFDTKEWAKETEPFADETMRKSCVLETHPAVLDGFIDMARDYAEKAAEQTQKEEEKSVAETAQQTQPKKNWIKVNVAQEALIKTYEKHSFMRMPETGEYAGYTYNVFNNRIKESRQITDLQSDGRELCYELLFAEDDVITLKTRDGDEVDLTAAEFKEAAGGSTSNDYIRKESENDRKWLNIKVPQEASRGMYENASLFVMPNKGGLAGYSFYIPNAFVSEDKESEDGSIAIRLPDDFEITVKDKDSGEIVKLSAAELYKQSNGTIASDYVYERKETVESDTAKDSDWKYIAVSEKARIAEYENRTLFKMPNGEYAGFTYYLPNALIKENENGTLRLSLPKDLIVFVKDGKSGDVGNLSADAFIEKVKGKTDEDYATAYQKPSEGKTNKFRCEAALRKNVPEEMKRKPNWVIVRTRENADTGRLDKYLIDCNTGKFAESDNEKTWTDFETACAYAKENGGETLAYALDGKDKICCIDVDNCKNGNDYTSNVPSEIVERVPGTYTENSISGNGVHVFGKTDGMDLRTFSTDGKLEFYQKSHFIAMTGDNNGITELKSFDTPEMKAYLESKCAKRSEWKGTGKGVDGLSSMSDRDVVEKAESSKHGDTFKALYTGQDLQGNHSNSDMSLMNRLAFWCNGDKEQMLRIFATSGLYRDGKSPDYYEGTAIKAIKDTTSRFKPQTQATPNPVTSNSSGSGKR